MTHKKNLLILSQTYYNSSINKRKNEIIFSQIISANQPMYI